MMMIEIINNDLTNNVMLHGSLWTKDGVNYAPRGGLPLTTGANA